MNSLCDSVASCSCSLNGIHAANLSEREAHLSYGSEKDRFFSSPEELNDRVMPLVEIPPQVIDDIIHENRRPHGKFVIHSSYLGDAFFPSCPMQMHQRPSPCTVLFLLCCHLYLPS